MSEVFHHDGGRSESRSDFSRPAPSPPNAARWGVAAEFGNLWTQLIEVWYNDKVQNSMRGCCSISCGFLTSQLAAVLMSTVTVSILIMMDSQAFVICAS